MKEIGNDLVIWCNGICGKEKDLRSPQILGSITGSASFLDSNAE